MLSCSYSATIGGLGSLVGTAPNVFLKGFMDEHYPNSGLNFLTFGMFAAPVSIILIFLSWIWLSIMWLPREYLFTLDCFRGPLSTNEQASPSTSEQSEEDRGCLNKMLKEKHERLGPITCYI